MLQKPVKVIFILSDASKSKPLKGIREELKTLRDGVLINSWQKNLIDIVERQDFEYSTLATELNKIQDHDIIIHYAGHSSDKGVIVQSGNKENLLTTENFCSLLETRAKQIKLVFLNSCYSKSIAERLNSIGIRYVLGTTKNVSDDDAVTVAFQFYNQLVSTPKTLLNAYEITRDYFKNSAPNKKLREIFNRSPDIDNIGEDEYPWHLFEGKNLSEEDKNWTLIPSATFKLSLEEAKKKIKILCIYDKVSLPYYKAISPILQSDNKLITHGIWEINIDFNLEDFEKELNASDIILHFVNDSDYIELISSTGTKDCFNDKNNFFLPIRGTLGVMTIYKWYSISQVIESDNKDFLIKLFGRFGSTLDDTRKLIPSFKTIGEIFNDFFFNSLRVKISQIFIDEIQLKKDLKEMPVIEVEEKFVSRPNKDAQLFNLIIEGTSDCAHQLVVNKIRMINQLHLKTKVLSFKSECGSSLITSVEGFWESLCSELGIDKNLIESSDYPKECIKCIIGILQSTNIIIVLENLEDKLLYNEVISSFWSDILQAKKNYNTKGGILKSNLFVCLTNKNIANLKFQSALSADEAISEIRISPIRFLSDTEFNSWKNTKKTKYSLQTFQKLSFDNIKITRDINTHSEDPPRKIAITNICQKLQCSDLIPDIDKEILQYE